MEVIAPTSDFWCQAFYKYTGIRTLTILNYILDRYQNSKSARFKGSSYFDFKAIIFTNVNKIKSKKIKTNFTWHKMSVFRFKF